MLENQMDYLRKNHLAMMSVCCLLPIIVILGLQLAGIKGWWVYPFAILACIGSHVLMMAMPGKREGGKTCH